jgi:hypothetical protein
MFSKEARQGAQVRNKLGESVDFGAGIPKSEKPKKAGTGSN